MREIAHNSAGFAAAGARRAAVGAGALQALNRSRAKRKADPARRIACVHDGLIAALCQRMFGLIRRACLLFVMSDKVGLSDAIRKSPNAARKSRKHPLRALA